MAFDKLYYFEKTPSYNETYGWQRRRHYYGEIQNHFNMSLVTDGTKDSCKVQVNNNISEELDPLTICWLESTNTWWVVKSDKVTRYTNEIGSYYTHDISLYGAFEILNARDLINCGFNARRYTLIEFFERLKTFMDFEFPIYWEFGSYADENITIPYLKTFQNYTPASAIKEMFNGMNLIPKLTFNTSGSENNVYLTSANIIAYSKSGSNKAPIDISYFDNEEEQSTSDIESFGTRVISNVQNCVSADPIRYPTFGGAKLTSNESTVKTGDNDNAILRLPSQVFSAKAIYLYFPFYSDLFPDIFPSYDNGDSFITYLESRGIFVSSSDRTTIKNWINNELVIKIQSGGVYNGIDGSRTGDWKKVYSDNTLSDEDIAFNSIQYAKTSLYTWDTITWEQGKDYISNVRVVDKSKSIASPLEVLGMRLIPAESNLTNSGFAVEYIPMGDLKIKVDNNKEQNDSNLYNQNGKLVDSVAISKLINSHAVEISSNELTRYKVVRSFNEVPEPTTIVLNGSDKYVINNVSVDFYENDDDNYFIVYQVTMTKQTACKSTMISANTNIRDYDCPQQNNVPRIQLYRDYIEFGYPNAEEHNEVPYMSVSDNIRFSLTEKGNTKKYNAFIGVYSTNFGSNSDNGNLYYHLASTRYNLNKQYLEVVDFKDNNIIGYEAGKSYYVFQISTLIGRKSSVVNTPITYVDDIGEIQGLTIRLLDDAELISAYSYVTDQGGLEVTELNTEIISNFVSVPIEAYNKSASFNDLEIVEENYEKDGLEVPVFEYSCQVGDANGIVFGADFLKGRSAESIKYYYRVVDSVAPITQENATLYMTQGVEMTTLPSFANNELTLTLTGNSTNTKNKNVVFWCEVFGEESSTYSHIYQTSSYFSNYYDGIQTITLPSHGQNSTFEIIDTIIASSSHTIDAIARIDSYDYDSNTIEYTLAEPRSLSETVDGVLTFQTQKEEYVSTRVNYYYGNTQQISMGTQNKQTSVLVGRVNCRSFDESAGAFYGEVVVDIPAIANRNATFWTNNSSFDVVIRLSSSGTTVRAIFYRNSPGYTSTNTTIYAQYQEQVVGYETSLIVSGGAIDTYTRGASIPSSGIPNYENTIVPFGTPNQFRITIYTYNQPQSGDYIMISYYAMRTTTNNIEVSGNGASSPITFNVAQYGQLVGTPTIAFSGDYIDPIVQITSFNQNTGEVSYRAYDNDELDRDVGVVFKYKETTSTGTIRDFLFSVNDCKVDATNSLTLKVNNWKLK